MTRKDYVLLANAISLGINGNEVTVDSDMMAIVVAVADALEADNPHFDRTRFLVACGVL